MKDLNLEKLSYLSGALSVALMITGSVIFGVYDYLPSGERIEEIFNQDSSAATLGGYIVTLAAFFMVWFAGSFYNVLRKQEGEGNDTCFPIIAFGGGLGSGLSLLIGYTTIIAAGARAGSGGGIIAVEASTLYDLYSQIMGQMFAVMLALFISASSVIYLRKGLFPGWAGWLSLLIAVGLLTPIGYIVIVFALAWMFLTSLWLFSLNIN